ATTTTNGTRALRACCGAKTVLISCFLNLTATARRIQSERDLLLVCSGTFDQVAYEDVLAAGALCDLLGVGGEISASARIAVELYRLARNDLAAALGSSRNGRRLLEHPDLCDDVTFCAQRDVYPLVAAMDPDGAVRLRP